LPFLRAGLAGGDKYICVIAVREPAEIVTALGPLGAESIPGGVNRLNVMRDVNLRSGTFSRRRAKPYKEFNRRCNHSVV
jgi:hypothetical protein